MARPDRAVLADAGLTVVLGVAFVASTAGATDARALDGLGWALVAANVLPLLALRRAPLLVVAWLCVAYPVWAALEYPSHLLQSLPSLVAVGAAGAAPRPLWWRALALLVPAEMLVFAASGIWPVDLLEIGYVAILFVSAWVLGVVLAARHGYTRALEEQTAALEAARQELARRAVLEERTRIARDLHDILAHAMSVITVQAGVGAHLLERDPEQAKGALRVIEETGRGALGEMRRLLGALRADDLPTEPQPGLASLDRLASQATAAGVPVELRVEGPSRPLPAGLEVSAYRIAQEALTNTIKHAPGGRARLTVRYRPHTVELEVVDSGGGPVPIHRGTPLGFPGPLRAPAGGDTGHGLRGMRERVALYGGVFEAGFVALLASDDGIDVVGQAADGAEAVALARRTSPQVALMDIRMPVLDGIAATRELRALPDPPEVVILTTFDTDEYAYQAFRAGACGFLVKDTPPVELLRAVHQTAAGGTVISPPTARRLVRDLAASQPDPRPTPAALQGLTERELEVLRLLARGHSNREIARELVISELTAKTHVSRILTKLNLLTRVHAVVFAYETGLVTPGTS